MRSCKLFLAVITVLFLQLSCTSQIKTSESGIVPIRVAKDAHYLSKENGDPFFWLGDTGWLLFGKLTTTQASLYLEDRREKGFNVIQVMLIHELSEKDVFGDPALENQDLSKPLVLSKSDKSKKTNYWDHVDSIINIANEKGIYMALVPVWGSIVKSGKVTTVQAEKYASFLANRYKKFPNVIWMNGGDIKGSDHQQVWQIIGETLHKLNPDKLITFHPRGRMQSSEWFHNEDWLSFNSVQSGHRRYDQDTSKGELHYGEDNYKYIKSDFNKRPIKPTLDAEPSYEGIPQGLHDTLQPKWTADDVRRYAYWSVFAGACGFTYGDNSVMQFHDAKMREVGAYGATIDWHVSLQDTGSKQLIYLKKLMLSRPYFERIPCDSLVADQGVRYDYLAATCGSDYCYIYTYNGRNFQLDMNYLKNKWVATSKHDFVINASWYNPKNGLTQNIGTISSALKQSFDPPGEKKNGNDWVLILEAKNN